MADEETIRIEVDASAVGNMPLETLELFDRAQEGKLSGKDTLDLLDGFVVGGVRGRGFKIKDLRAIAKAVSEAVGAQASGGTSATG